MYSDGAKFWYVNNKLHREDGPAIERANGDKVWYLNNRRHRENGPAIEYANGETEYWINGKYIPQLHNKKIYGKEKLANYRLLRSDSRKPATSSRGMNASSVNNYFHLFS